MIASLKDRELGAFLTVYMMWGGAQEEFLKA